MKAKFVLAWFWMISACSLDEAGVSGSRSAGGAGGSAPGGVGTGGEGGTQTPANDASGVTPVPGPDSATTGRDSSMVGRTVDAGARDATLSGCDAITLHSRADQALASLMTGLWNSTSQYFDQAEPTTGNLTGYWTFAQAWDSVIDGAVRTGQRHYAGLVPMLYAAQNARGWSSNYYDDENWMTMALMRAYDMLGDHAYLDRALMLYLDITAAWDSTSAHPGGIWWDRAHTQKATASNAGPVIAGARLAARTGDPTHLAFAQMVYDFWFTNMVNPTTHKLADHMLPDGTIAQGTLTYNEGLMSGAAYALYLATSDPRYLTDAHAIATALKNQGKTTAIGPVFSDGTNTGCTGDCPQWKGIGYRYLALLFGSDFSHTEYRPVLEASVESAWTVARNPATGFFANDWRGPTMPTAPVESQSSTAMALSLWADLCGPYPGDPVNAYEAEDAMSSHVAFEATHAGFSGWGYVTAWTAANQWVEFTVPAATAGSYAVTFDYAAPDGDAVRSISVNGTTLAAALTFPSTGSLDVWGHASTNVSLIAGNNLIRLTFDTAKGSTRAMNLDRLTLGP